MSQRSFMFSDPDEAIRWIHEAKFSVEIRPSDLKKFSTPSSQYHYSSTYRSRVSVSQEQFTVFYVEAFGEMFPSSYEDLPLLAEFLVRLKFTVLKKRMGYYAGLDIGEISDDNNLKTNKDIEISFKEMNKLRDKLRATKEAETAYKESVKQEKIRVAKLARKSAGTEEEGSWEDDGGAAPSVGPAQTDGKKGEQMVMPQEAPMLDRFERPATTEQVPAARPTDPWAS